MSVGAEVDGRALPRWRVLAFGSVQLPLGTIGLPIAIYLAPLYAGQLGLSLQLIGIAMILARLSDFVTDPIIGVLTDRWRPAIGRRKIWLILGTAVMMLGIFLLFRPLPGATIVYFLAALATVYLGYTMLLLPHASWAGELATDYHARTRISSISQFFSIAGLIVSTLIPTWVLMRQGATSADVMAAISIFVLLALPLCSGLAFAVVPEPKAPIRKAPLNLRAAVRMLASNKAFMIVTVLLMIGTIGEVFRQTITVFFARDVVGVPNIGLIYFIYFVAALVAVPVWTWLANRIEKHRALALALALVALTNAAMFFVGRGQVALFTGLFVLKGVCYGAVLMLPHAMVADTVDIDTAETLDRQQGIFFAAIAMVQKLGYALGAGMPLILLGWVGYNSGGETRADPLLALTISYSIIPSILVFIAAAMALRYGLTSSAHRTIRDRIDMRAAAVIAAEQTPVEKTA